MDYRNINENTWPQILAGNGFKWQPPITTHLPIQPVHSPDFIHVDSALNVCRRRVAPRLFATDIDERRKISDSDVLLVQFALDGPPFVPDFHCSTLSLAEGKYPVATAEYFAWEMFYRFEYYCTSLNERQNILWISCTVKNEDDKPRDADVRAKVNFQPENDIFEYHYARFYWDITKWRPCDSVGLDGHLITRNGQVFGNAVPGDFSLAWQEQGNWVDDDFNKRFCCPSPYFVTPTMRLKEIRNVLHFTKKNIQPNQEATFHLGLLTNFEDVAEQDLKTLKAAKPQSSKAEAIEYFKAQLPEDGTQLECQAGNWGCIFSEAQLSTLQLLVKFPDNSDLMPTQGGTSERHFVWVWEAICMLRAMLPLGHREPIRRALDFIFSLQDGGCPPVGKFTTTEGSVGTTGPRWANSTGSALALAADYYIYTREEDFLKEYLPKILRGANWIVGEISATRKLNPDGTRPAWFGLMPFACATDGDDGYIIAFTDSYTYWGLEKVVRLLENIGHEDAPRMRGELIQYRKDINQAVLSLTRSDGYIERKILTGDEDKIAGKFENICGAMQLAFTGAIDADSKAFFKFTRYIEEKVANGFFMGAMDREVMYIGLAEWIWQDLYLRMGEWKKAFVVAQASLKYGITQDTFQVQERFSKINPAYTPWQPNGSGNGRVLDMIVKSFYFDNDGVATILGGIPFEWLTDNGETAIRNLRIPAGEVSIEVKPGMGDKMLVKISASCVEAMPRQIKFPSHFIAEACEDQPLEMNFSLTKNVSAAAT